MIITWPLDTPANFTYDPALVEITGGKAKLKLIGNAGQTFNQPFDSGAGFTYDAAKAEFTGGLVRQKNTRPAGCTLQATFPTGKDSDFADGSITNSLIGGATWDAGRINLTGRSGKQMNMPGAGGNFSTVGDAGCIRFKYRPNYTGAPALNMILLEFDSDTGNNNAILITHRSANDFSVELFDSAGASHIFYSSPVSFVAGTDYVIELDFNFSDVSRLFIDGVLKGSLNTAPWARAAQSGVFMWGGNGGSCDGWLDDVLLFSAVQHTAAHSGELPYTYFPYVYNYSVVIPPVFSYSGLGTLQAFTAFAATVLNGPRFLVNGKYWTGTAWAVSDNTFSQANSAATVNTNIGSLTPADSITVKLVFDNSNTLQMNCGDLTLTYTGQIYPTSNPTVAPANPIYGESASVFSEVSAAAGSDSVRFVLQVAGINYYWNGTAWAVSSGYAQSNTAAEINANIAGVTLPAGTAVKFLAYLHSGAGNTTPNLTSVSITYDYAAPVPTEPSECLVYGFLYNADGTPAEGVAVQAALTQQGLYNSAVQVAPDAVKTTTRASGYWELSLINTAKMTPAGIKYEFKFTTAYTGKAGAMSREETARKSVPDLVTANYATL